MWLCGRLFCQRQNAKTSFKQHADNNYICIQLFLLAFFSFYLPFTFLSQESFKAIMPDDLSLSAYYKSFGISRIFLRKRKKESQQRGDRNRNSLGKRNSIQSSRIKSLRDHKMRLWKKSQTNPSNMTTNAQYLIQF